MAKGTKGRGTMPFQWKTSPKGQFKDIIAGVGQQTPMPQTYRGRVVYGGTSRTGRKEGTGPES